MSWFDDLTGGGIANQASENRGLLEELGRSLNTIYDRGLAKSSGTIKDAMVPFSALAGKYGKGTDLYLDSLGVNGPTGNTRATDAFMAGPGYQWQMDQAIDAVNRGADARGMLRGGNTAAATADRASGLARQEYGNWQSRLGGLINPELTATTGNAGLSTTLAGLYDSDATRRAAAASNMYGGIISNNNMGAQAEMTGAATLGNLGMNLLKLGVGAAGGGFGGFSGFGGGGSPSMVYGGAGDYGVPTFPR